MQLRDGLGRVVTRFGAIEPRRVARAPGDELVAVEQPGVRGDQFHHGLARPHKAGVVGAEEVEVGAERDGFQLQVFERAGQRLEFLRSWLEEERHLHRVEAGGGNRRGSLLQLGGRTALQHHAEAEVVFRGFGAEEFRRAEAGDTCSDGAEKMPA